MKTIKPVNDYVFLEWIENKNKTEGGIFIPEAAMEKSMTATVIDGGFSGFAAGEIVMIEKYHNGTEVSIDGKKFVLVKHTQIIATIGDEA